MPQDPEKCEKCGGTMEQGFVVDMSYMACEVSSWGKGVPRAGFLGGTKLPSGTRIPIRIFRCDECGYLEHYARREFRSQ